MAAEAAEAAGAQGVFWEYHDLLFERQAEWGRLSEDSAGEFFAGLAEELELDVTLFSSALDDHIYRDYILTSRDEALGMGMPGTPAVIFNGQPIPNVPYDYELWETAVSDIVKLAELEAAQYADAPEIVIDNDAIYRVTVTMESGNVFVMELYPHSAPLTVNSFVFLAREGWFDGITFHRVIPGFVAQTGDPTGTGLGGPGYTIPNEVDPTLTHAEIGMVAMANSGPDTNGSQWYITLGDAEFLDGNYTIFGRVVEGLDAVQQITPRDPSSGDLPPGDIISSVTVEEISE